MSKKNTETIRSELKLLFKTANIELARSVKNDLVEKYSKKYSNMVECLDEGFEYGFQYCAIEEQTIQDLKASTCWSE